MGARREGKVHLRREDIVTERLGAFGVEIILADRVADLPRLPERPNSVSYVKDQVVPVIIVEVFDLPTGVLSSRFPRTEQLVEGENLFFDHPGRI
jgi:hypothetical protein